MGGYSLRITVNDHKGKPAEGIRVRLYKDDKMIGEKLTDKEGIAVFEGLSQGDYYIEVEELVNRKEEPHGYSISSGANIKIETIKDGKVVGQISESRRYYSSYRRGTEIDDEIYDEITEHFKSVRRMMEKMERMMEEMLDELFERPKTFRKRLTLRDEEKERKGDIDMGPLSKV